MHMGGNQGVRRIAAEGWSPGEKLIEAAAKRVDVRSRVWSPRLCCQFRGEICGFAQKAPAVRGFLRAGQLEAGDLEGTAVPNQVTGPHIGMVEAGIFVHGM